MTTQTVKTREYDLATQVRKAWGEEWKSPVPAYSFNNGKIFNSPEGRGGPYAHNTTGVTAIIRASWNGQHIDLTLVDYFTTL